MTAGIVLLSLLVIAALVPTGGGHMRPTETMADIDPQHLGQTR